MEKKDLQFGAKMDETNAKLTGNSPFIENSDKIFNCCPEVLVIYQTIFGTSQREKGRNSYTEKIFTVQIEAQLEMYQQYCLIVWIDGKGRRLISEVLNVYTWFLVLVLKQLRTEMRGNLTYCPSGRQLTTRTSQCGNVDHKDFRGHGNKYCRAGKSPFVKLPCELYIKMA